MNLYINYIMNSYVRIHDHEFICYMYFMTYEFRYEFRHVHEEYREIIPEIMGTKVPDVLGSTSGWRLRPRAQTLVSKAFLPPHWQCGQRQRLQVTQKLGCSPDNRNSVPVGEARDLARTVGSG